MLECTVVGALATVLCRSSIAEFLHYSVSMQECLINHVI